MAALLCTCRLGLPDRPDRVPPDPLPRSRQGVAARDLESARHRRHGALAVAMTASVFLVTDLLFGRHHDRAVITVPRRRPVRDGLVRAADVPEARTSLSRASRRAGSPRAERRRCSRPRRCRRASSPAHLGRRARRRRASAPAPSAITRARSASSRTAAAVSLERDDEAPASSGRARSHIAGSTTLAPEPSTNDGSYSASRGSPGVERRANGRARLGLHRVDPRLGAQRLAARSRSR